MLICHIWALSKLLNSSLIFFRYLVASTLVAADSDYWPPFHSVWYWPTMEWLCSRWIRASLSARAPKFSNFCYIHDNIWLPALMRSALILFQGPVRGHCDVSVLNWEHCQSHYCNVIMLLQCCCHLYANLLKCWSSDDAHYYNLSGVTLLLIHLLQYLTQTV